MTSPATPSIANRIISYGINKVYPRNAAIASASASAAWYGHRWSQTYTQPYLLNLFTTVGSRGLSGLLPYFVSESTERTSISDTLTHFFTPLWYPDYIYEYLPQIHSAISFGAAITVSFTLNMLAKAIFGTKSDASLQVEPLNNALGVETASVQAQPNPLKTVIKHREAIRNDDLKKIVKAKKIDEKKVSEKEIKEKEIAAVTQKANTPHSSTEEGDIGTLLYGKKDIKKSEGTSFLPKPIHKFLNNACRC